MYLADDAAIELLGVILKVPRERVHVREALAAVCARVYAPRATRRRGARGRVRRRHVPLKLIPRVERCGALRATTCKLNEENTFNTIKN